MIHESAIEETDAFLPGFQCIIQLGDALLDFFSLHIGVVWDVSDILKLVPFFHGVVLTEPSSLFLP